MPAPGLFVWLPENYEEHERPTDEPMTRTLTSPAVFLNLSRYSEYRNRCGVPGHEPGSVLGVPRAIYGERGQIVPIGMFSGR